MNRVQDSRAKYVEEKYKELPNVEKWSNEHYFIEEVCEIGKINNWKYFFFFTIISIFTDLKVILPTHVPNNTECFMNFFIN